MKHEVEKEVKQRLKGLVDDFEMKAFLDVAGRVDNKRAHKFDNFGPKHQSRFIDQFELKQPGLYDLMAEIVESVSREQLPEVMTAFSIVLAQHLTFQED